MPRKDIEFKTIDQVTLRGWLYTPSTPKNASQKFPCLVMVHGWSCVKEMELPKVAEHLVSKLDIAVVVYDHRGFGSSDTGKGQPVREIVPWEQQSDMSDAITWASLQDGIDEDRIGVWGYSYGGGMAVCVGAADKRVACVVATAPVLSGNGQVERLVPPAMREATWQAFAGDRQARITGAEPARIPVVSSDPLGIASMPLPEAYKWFSSWESKAPTWVNDMTVRTSYLCPTLEATGQIQFISPRPLLMFAAGKDCAAPIELATEAFNLAREPKRIEVLDRAGHFDIFEGRWFERMMGVTVEFLGEKL